MSGYGGSSYGRGPPQQQYAQQQQQQHQQGAYGQYQAAPHDPYSNANSQYGADTHEQQPFETLYEQEEPTSPEMNRGYEQHAAGQQQYDAYGDHQASDASVQDPSRQQGFEAPYYPGWIYDAATNQYLPDPDYHGEADAEQDGQAAAQADDQYGQQQTPQQQQQQYDSQYSESADQYGYGTQETGQYGQGGAEQKQDQGAAPDDAAFEPPHYPGWLYDSATNSYVPDPNYQGEGAEDDSQGGQESQQGDGYGANGTSYGDDQATDDAYAQISEDPYAADSNPYANEQERADPYSQPDSHDPYSQAQQQQQQDPYARSEYDAHQEQYGGYGRQNDAGAYGEQRAGGYGESAQDPYGQQTTDHEEDRGQFAPQQASYDPYAPAPPASQAGSARNGPASPTLSQNGYAPGPAEQQYTSFAAAYDQPSPQEQEPNQAYDPYAPSQQQQAPPPAKQQQQAPVPQIRELGRGRATSDAYAMSSEANDDPYAPRAARSPTTRRPTVSRPAVALSPNLSASPALNAIDPTPESLPLAAAPPRSDTASGGALMAPPPPRASPAPAGPPPKTGQASASSAAVSAPPRSNASVAASSPRSDAGPGFASPPMRPAQPPANSGQQQSRPPPAAQASAGAAFDIPPLRQGAAGRSAPNAPRDNRGLQANSAPVSYATEQEPPRRNAPADAYAPPPASRPAREAYAPAGQPVQAAVHPPQQRKPAAGGLQPPARRAPHQRGASAFAGDSPYGAPPQGPPTSMYEPPQAVEEIKEEDEDEEMPQQNEQEPERPEEYMPSWMQATVTAPPPQATPYSPPQQAQARPRPNGRPSFDAPISPLIEQEAPKRSLRGPAKLDAGDDLAAGMQGMSLAGRKSPAGPPPPRTGGQAPPPRASGQAPPPRAQAAAAQPPPRGAPMPPRSSAGAARGGQGQGPATRGGPLSPREEAPSFQRQQQEHYAPPSQSQPQRRVPPGTPDRYAVPQLNFEAPSPSEHHAPSDRGDRYGYNGSGRTTPVPMAGIEETPEPQDPEQEDYFGGGSSSANRTESAAGSQYAPTTEDGQMTGPTTPSSHYGGDWKADSQQRGGYDYIKQEHQQYGAPADPYAPSASSASRSEEAYAPRDYPSREDSRTPSAPAPSQTAYASPPSRSAAQQPFKTRRAAPPAQPQPQQQQRKAAGESYSPYAPAQPSAMPGNDKPYDPYAAAPSTSGASTQPSADLGLERRSAPVVSFGFGGRMLLVFPRGRQPSYGIDGANPYGAPNQQEQASTPSTVHVRKLDEIVPQAGEGSPFPGPIFLDGGKANSSKKRKEALAWLSQRIGELEQDFAYARGAPSTGFGSEHAAEREEQIGARLLLVKLLRVMLENEGKIVGSSQIDDAVRAILNPDATTDTANSNPLPTADQLAAAASTRSEPSASPFVTYGVSGSDLDEMTSHLLRGDRREAVQYAVEHSMWAHAFIIASCVDTDCWKDVTNEFLRAELMPSSDHTGPGAEGREALRVAYGMFAGLGDESIQQLIPPQSLAPGNATSGFSTSMSRSGSQNGASPPLSKEALEKWQETVGMIVANRTAGDSAALTSLGDALLANGRIDAAHVCYLLSPQTSFAGGMGMPNSRIILLGSIPFATDSSIDLESVKLTEMLEYALSLVPVLKGHEPFVGLPHLQAFRLYHAATLADAGDVSRAHKYTEAIVNTLKLATKPTPFYHPRLVAQIKTLTERLGAAPGQKETGSWLTRKVPRPTVNSLWSTFEGGFNKFVAGEGEPTPQQLAAKAEVAQQTNGAPVGAFSHFSSIAPDSTGGLLSRTQSSTELASSDYLHPSLPVRPSSATRPTSPLAAPASSPLGPNPQHQQSPGPPPVKRASFKTHHARSSSLGAFAGYDYSPVAPPPWQSYTPPSLPGRGRIGEGQDGQPTSPRGQPTSPRGPPSSRRPQFAAVEERLQEDESGFISPMAHLTPSVSPSPASGRQNMDQSQTHRRMTTAEELADLGIGNSKSKKPAFDTLEEELEAEEGGMAPPPKKPESGPSLGGDDASASQGQQGGKSDEKPTIKPSKSWLGGWFKREASPAANGPGPVRANLGESSGFHYDKNLGRWVNKAGKGPDEASSPVIPPPRASTASPSRAMRAEPARFSSEAPPPVPPMPTRSQTGPMPPLSRSATTSDLRGDARPPSAASNPTRPPSATGLPPRMGGAGTPTEGLSRPSSTRGKKPKYVVVPP